MSDIKKQLVLEVSFARQKLQAEVSKLKKELESNLGGTQAKATGSQDIQKQREITKAYQQRQRIEDQVAKAHAQRTRDTQREESRKVSQADKMFRQEERRRAREKEQTDKQLAREEKQNEQSIAKEESLKIRAAKREETRTLRANEKQAKEQERAQKKIERESEKAKDKEIRVTQREENRKQRIAAREVQQRERDRQREVARDKQAAIEQYNLLKQKRLEQSIQNSQMDRSMGARIGRGLGMSGGGARRFGAALPGMIAGAGTALAAAGEGLNLKEDFLSYRARVRNEKASDLLSGQYVSAASGVAGRDIGVDNWVAGAGGALAGATKGAIVGGAAGAGLGLLTAGALSAPMAAIGAIGGGLIGGAKGAFEDFTGYREKKAARFKEETRLLQDSANAAMGLNAGRLDMLRGGSDRLFLNTNEQMGTSEGYAPGETQKQYATLQDRLGNGISKFAASSFRTMNQATGAGVGEYADFLLASEGANRGGRSNIAGAESLVAKAIASGLDRSKTSKFLQEATDVVTSQTGFSRVDSQGISEKLASLARSFGGGTIDDTSLAQAKSAMNAQLSESYQTSGLAGAGNYLGIQKLAKDAGVNLNQDQLLGLMSLSSNASSGDISKMLGSNVSPEALNKFTSGFAGMKGNNLSTTLDNINGGAGISSFLAAQAMGTSGDQAMARLAGQAGATPLSEGVSLKDMGDSVKGTAEFQMQSRDAQMQQQMIDLGRATFKSAIENTASDLKSLTEAFQRATTAFNEQMKDMGRSGINRTATPNSGRGN